MICSWRQVVAAVCHNVSRKYIIQQRHICSTVMPGMKLAKETQEKSDPESDPASKLKKVMRTVPQPVVVITAAVWDEMQQIWVKRGITCSSFTSVSMDPPIVSVCIGRLGKPSEMHNLLLHTQHFAIHVLAKDQVNQSVRFATPVENSTEDHFAGIPHSRGPQNVPILDNATAVIECQGKSVHPIGDHFVWYGEVMDATTNENHADPLLYYRKSYRTVGDEMFMQAFEDTTFPFDQWTHEAHVRMAWNYIKEHGKEEATPLIKSGIKKYNQQNKHLITRGYSETVTLFYIYMIDDAIQKSKRMDTSFDDFLKQNSYIMDRDLLFQYYSRDCLNNSDSHERFIYPDIKKLPGS